MAVRNASIKAYYNFLLSKYEMYKGTTQVRSLPYYLVLDPAERCQLRCPTCPTGIENELRYQKSDRPVVFRKNRAMLSEELFDNLMDDLGDTLFMILFYNYGEPLLNKNLHRYIEKATQLNIHSEVHSNLSLPLSDERIESLLRSGLGTLFASVDGFTQESYERHRVGGDIALVKHNIERLARTRDQLGVKTQIVYKMLRFSFTEDDIPHAKAYCDDLGIGFMAGDAFINDPDWLPSDRKGESPVPVAESVRYQPDLVQSWLPQFASQQGDYPEACAWHYGYSLVTAAGPVSPCCMLPFDRYDYGAVKPGKTSFPQIWNSHEVQSARKSQMQKQTNEDGSICARCPYPTPLRHLYSFHDRLIAEYYLHNVYGQDAVLDTAFDLLSKARFGATLSSIFERPGSFPEHRSTDTERSAGHVGAFVDYIDNNLVHFVKI